MSFTVYLPPEDPITGLQWGSPAPELVLKRKWHRSNVFGGPVGAEVEIHGPPNALWEILEWLRRPLEIYSENQQLVWWGLVNEVRLQWGRMTVGLTLDEMANTVTITYTSTSVTGATVRGVTGTVQDALSVGRYGIKELYESLGEAGEAMAVARQTQLLADKANPPKVRSFGGGSTGSPTGLVVAVGWMETLRWRRFNRLEGRIEFDGEAFDSGGTQAIGWGLTASNQIGFASGALHDLAARLKGLWEGARVAVSGSALNNNVYTVTATTNDGQVNYTANTIAFVPVDDIDDKVGKGLGKFRTENFLQVQNSLWNDGYHLIKQGGDDHLAMQSSFTGLIYNEAAGNSITLTQGHKVEVTGATISNEKPGASVTLRVYGYEMAQAFVASHNMTLVDKLGLKVGKVGAPGDSFEFGLWSDSASLPLALLASTSLVGSTLEDKPTWTWFDVANVVGLTLGQRYWLFARRTGGLDPLNYYTVEMAGGTYDLCKVWTGAAWVDHPQGYAMPFKVWGAEDTCDQIKRILTDKGQFLAGIDMQTALSGVQTNPWRNNDMSAYDELMKLLKGGTSTGQRLLANVTVDRMAQIYTEPVDLGDGDFYNPLDGSIRLAAGGRRPSGLLPTGEWLMVDEVPDFAANGISPVFVDDSECGDDGDVYEITPK